jgi:NUMOD3 motif
MDTSEDERWQFDEDDPGELMPNIQRYRISLMLLRLVDPKGEEFPHLKGVQETLAQQIVRYDGPGNRSGAVLTEEVRAKMAAAKLGKPRKPFSEETKRRMSLAKSGANNPNFGRKFSDSTKALLSELSVRREEVKRRKVNNIIPMPPPEFTRGQMGKANRALKKLGNLNPLEEDKAAFLRFLNSIGIDPMQASSRMLARIYADRTRPKEAP